MQDVGRSTAGGGPQRPHVDTNPEKLQTCRNYGGPPNPQATTANTPQVIAIKAGEHIREGYAYVVQKSADNVGGGRMQQRNTSDIVDLTTPAKATERRAGEVPDTTKMRNAARRNLTRNSNRKANATFVKDLKVSLATGQPMAIKVPEDSNDLKATWHAAAKEIAYKLLDLTKESWKEYSIFEKSLVHNEVNEQFEFAHPIDPKRIDKYLSGHLRTSRAVWKAHWKKHGQNNRHHNCPEAVWEKLSQWWPTTACREEAEEMAGRRAMVQSGSKVGRSSVLDRMDEQVRNVWVFIAMVCLHLLLLYWDCRVERDVRECSAKPRRSAAT